MWQTVHRSHLCLIWNKGRSSRGPWHVEMSCAVLKTQNMPYIRLQTGDNLTEPPSLMAARSKPNNGKHAVNHLRLFPPADGGLLWGAAVPWQRATLPLLAIVCSRWQLQVLSGHPPTTQQQKPKPPQRRDVCIRKAKHSRDTLHFRSSWLVWLF